MSDTLFIKGVGKSMYPFLSDRTLLRVNADTSQTYRVGDIICFIQSNSTITHRVIVVNKSKVLTKGDACVRSDQWLKVSQIIGKAEVVFTPDRKISLSLPRQIIIHTAIGHLSRVSLICPSIRFINNYILKLLTIISYA